MNKMSRCFDYEVNGRLKNLIENNQPLPELFSICKKYKSEEKEYDNDEYSKKTSS